MSSDGTRGDVLDVRALLEAWRESGADRAAPARFRLMDAMERRAAAHGGEARRLLDGRLAALIQAYEADLEGASRLDAPEPEAAPRERGPLGQLADRLAGPVSADRDGPDLAELRAAYPELAMLEYFRGVWSQVSADRQVRQSQEQVHKNAGPLNSNQLVHRTLSLMRGLSPGYLQQFLSYTDALMWMEQMAAAAAPPPKDAPRAGAKKTARKAR
ncbi:hypothetical protein AVE30378_05786 [Achromobacter veterisilvae]|uniref:DUF2894 domain-containing protein n=1 Tax=Achromobacter veterisilvae TaxID=2069367 RepID=A0A446D008_9BURK|nr:DUF2894 domain-containing protein [Achromobacter veterisilvae]SSW73436.1 hypothetical protein AVE30378_05786 [Achromobacter veterisilvae]